MTEVVAGVTMALLAIASVGLWTLRVALTARGRRAVGAGVAAVEAVVFAVAFTNVATNLGSPPRLAGYGIGVALGTLAGLTLDSRLSPGVSEIDIVLPGDDPGAAEALHRLGWPATTFPGQGPLGPVTLICLVVDDRRIGEVTAAIARVAPHAFWTVQRLGHAHATVLPPGYLQIAEGRLS